MRRRNIMLIKKAGGDRNLSTDDNCGGLESCRGGEGRGGRKPLYRKSLTTVIKFESGHWIPIRQCTYVSFF